MTHPEDVWCHDNFEVVGDGSRDYADFGMALVGGSLEVYTSRLGESREGYEELQTKTCKFSPERTVEVIVGMQAWMEQLDDRP